MADFNYTTDFFQDSDGFGVPRLGGNVAVRYNTVAYTDTSAKRLFTLPQGSIIVDYTVFVTTDFDSGDTGTLEVGLGSDPDALVNDLNVLAAGDTRNDAGGAAASLLTNVFAAALDVDTDVTATYTGAGTAATEGEAIVAVYYIRK